MAAWSTVPKTDLGRVLQAAGAAVLGWLRLAQGVAGVAVGAVVAGGAGYVLMEQDRTLPRLVRQFVGLWAGRYSVPLAALLPSDTGAIRTLSMALFLVGLVAAGWGALVLCIWFLERRE